MLEKLLQFIIISLFALLFITAGPISSYAAVIVLQPGLEGKDSHIQEAYPDANNGNSTNGQFGSYLGYDNLRILMEFDLSAIPSDALITQATLTIQNSAPAGWDHVYRGHVYSILESWEEDGVTWNNRNSADAWSVPGGVFDSVTEWGTAEFSGSVSVDFDITSLVQEWNDGDLPNYGLMLYPETLYVAPGGSPTNNYVFPYLSDTDQIAFRPMLTVDYIPIPSAFWLLGPAFIGLLGFRRRFTN